jgi:hypothetical protein
MASEKPKESNTMTDYQKFFEAGSLERRMEEETRYQAFKQRLEAERIAEHNQKVADKLGGLGCVVSLMGNLHKQRGCDHLGQVGINRNGETICGDCGDVIVPKESGHE